MFTQFFTSFQWTRNTQTYHDVQNGNQLHWNSNKEKKCGISYIRITKYYQIWLSWGNERSCWEAGVSAIQLPCRAIVMGWCGHSFEPKAIIALLALLKAGFNDTAFSPGASNLITTRRTNPTWLIFCLRNVKVKIFFNFCFVTPSRRLNNKILSLKPSDKKCFENKHATPSVRLSLPT